MARREAAYNDRMGNSGGWSMQDDLYRMRNLNPKVMTKAEKKYRNRVIKDAERTIRTNSPRSFASKVTGQVAKASQRHYFYSFLQGTPAGEVPQIWTRDRKQ